MFTNLLANDITIGFKKAKTKVKSNNNLCTNLLAND